MFYINNFEFKFGGFHLVSLKKINIISRTRPSLFIYKKFIFFLNILLKKESGNSGLYVQTVFVKHICETS